ncbi:hypothetical protein GCM10011351_30530 [Paraliobacillus quinghaiensis]|uniref:Uncharacterized protein n=1 Tax=Paraliobacillus quinghaiensis TaxID=470815 RepID=A0A917TX35_9BACI|nr:hypothetical protein [Paraliobacillus quinghaiensis]GGM42409.1 hypothetical protein GCM10011351_30530 [Paraliobacillus quinghaiensis]
MFNYEKQFTKWSKTRKMGIYKFVLMYGLLVAGSIYFISSLLLSYFLGSINNNTIPHYLFDAVAWAILTGIGIWFVMEWNYKNHLSEKDERGRKTTMGKRLILVLILIELIAIQLVDSLIYGLLDIWLFILALIIQLLFFMFIQKVEKVKDFIVHIVLLVSIPALFIYILPSTTYEGGKAIVQNETDDEVTFLSTDYKLVPTAGKSEWFIKKYNYHYEVEGSGEKLFYMVDPATGKSYQLEEDFFRYYR